MKTKEKAGTGATVTDLRNHSIAGGNQKAIDVSNFITTEGKIQSDVLALVNTKPRKVIRLHRCFTCNGCFALLKFSVYLGICKKCFANRDAKTPERLSFARQAARNVQRILGGVIL